MLAQRWEPWERNDDENVANELTVTTPAPFIPEVVALAKRARQSQTVIPNLAMIIQNLAHDKECRQVAITAAEQYSRFSYNTDGVLIRGLRIDSTLQKYVHAKRCGPLSLL